MSGHARAAHVRETVVLTIAGIMVMPGIATNAKPKSRPLLLLTIFDGYARRAVA